MSESIIMNGNNRTDYLSWEEYFMATAFLAAKRSKDPNTQVGACIVDDHNRIVGVGYNGFPRGCKDSEFPWTKNSSEPLEQKHMYVVHAEVNAILNKNNADVSGTKMYVALFPCNECAKIIIQSGIREVIYMSDKHEAKSHTKGAKRMFDAACVKYRQFTPRQKTITISFADIDWEMQNQVPLTPLKNVALN